MILHIYNEYESIPTHYREQWRRLRYKKYRTVPIFQAKWEKGTAAAVAMLLTEDSTKLLAWAMGVAVPSELDGKTEAPTWHLMTYVRRNERRKGYATRVVTALRGFLVATYKLDHSPVVYPHDEASAAFLVRQGLIDRSDKFVVKYLG